MAYFMNNSWAVLFAHFRPNSHISNIALSCRWRKSWHTHTHTHTHKQKKNSARENDVNAYVILPGTHHSAGGCVWSLDTYFNPAPIDHLYVLFVEISYQARFCLQISYPAILFTMLMYLIVAVLSYTSFCREQAKRWHCQFSCRAHAVTSFCRACTVTCRDTHTQRWK